MLNLIHNILMECVKVTPIPVGQLLEINYDPVWMVYSKIKQANLFILT